MHMLSIAYSSGTPREQNRREIALFLDYLDNSIKFGSELKGEKKRHLTAKMASYLGNLFPPDSAFQDRWFQPLTHPSGNCEFGRNYLTRRHSTASTITIRLAGYKVALLIDF
jgi:hypothetical protein